jgi:Uma2 family endonuclease
MSALARSTHEWSEDEYLAFENDSETKHEFLDGEIYAMAGAKPLHNAICHNVGTALGNLIRGSGCRGFTSDQRIHVARPKKYYTYADGGVACGKWEISDKDGMSLLNPVLLFEVLSSSTRKYDRGTKLLLYQQIPSLTDVLLIDQPQHLVEHHHRGPRGGWKMTSHKRGQVAVLSGVLQLDEIYDVPPGLE